MAGRLASGSHLWAAAARACAERASATRARRTVLSETVKAKAEEASQSAAGEIVIIIILPCLQAPPPSRKDSRSLCATNEKPER